MTIHNLLPSEHGNRDTSLSVCWQDLWRGKKEQKSIAAQIHLFLGLESVIWVSLATPPPICCMNYLLGSMCIVLASAKLSSGSQGECWQPHACMDYLKGIYLTCSNVTPLIRMTDVSAYQAVDILCSVYRQLCWWKRFFLELLLLSFLPWETYLMDLQTELIFTL